MRRIFNAPVSLYRSLFEEKEYKFDNLSFNGRFSGILKKSNNVYELKLSTGNKNKVKLVFDISGHKVYIDGHLKKQKKDIIIEDELIHTIKFE